MALLLLLLTLSAGACDKLPKELDEHQGIPDGVASHTSGQDTTTDTIPSADALVDTGATDLGPGAHPGESGARG